MKKFLVMLLAIAGIGVASAQTVNADVVVKISNNKFEKRINVPQSCVTIVARLIEDTLPEKDVALIHECLGEVINTAEKTFYFDNMSLYFNNSKGVVIFKGHGYTIELNNIRDYQNIFRM
jgi:hypothetical protein